VSNLLQRDVNELLPEAYPYAASIIHSM